MIFSNNKARKESNEKNKREQPILLLLPIILVMLAALFIIFFRSNGSVSSSEQIDTTNSESAAYTLTIKTAADLDTTVPPSVVIQSELRRDLSYVALIIDDFGPGLNSKLVQGFVDLPYDITISIIPGNSHSAKVGKMAERAGKEVFIHLPMEPIDPISMDEPDMVYADTDSLTLHGIIDRIARELPQAIGVNNHMGSNATLKEGLMARLAEECKERNWIFIDSRTVPHSYGLPQMRKAGVPSAGRDIFLDLDRKEIVIRDQLDKTVNLARTRGWSIGIGHVRKNTLKVLRDLLPEYEKEGIHFVFITELLANIENSAETTFTVNDILPQQ